MTPTDTRWTEFHIPDQTGRTAIVTGANSGIGFEAARALAVKGAHVVLACRSEERGSQAVSSIESIEPAGSVELALLDLASLDSIRRFARGTQARIDRLDLLINNAGVMIPPRSRTADGFELQFGVNHLGHFALTGLLLPLLQKQAGARVVTVASLAHRAGRVDLDDPNFDRRSYRRIVAYAQSKLANLLFAFELQRKLDLTGAPPLSMAAHPGWTISELQRHAVWVRALNPLLGQSAARGALPTLRAATAPDGIGGEYYGPDGMFQIQGYPKRVGTSRRARDRALAARLWQKSEEWTGVRYEGLLGASRSARAK